MMVKIMSDSKRIKEKVHFYVSILAGADHPPSYIRHYGCIYFIGKTTFKAYITSFLANLVKLLT